MPSRLFKNVKFLKSAAKPADYPNSHLPEIAIAGRSNVGKSSTINTLFTMNKLARTSQTPGRTQLINYFAVNEQWYFVDLPGFGYAKVSKEMKKDWNEVIDTYLRSTNLAALILVVDIRRPIRDFELDLMQWAKECQIPCLVCLNKSDKFSRNVAKSTWLKCQPSIIGRFPNAEVILFSALNKTGVDEAQNFIAKILAKHGIVAEEKK
jgi:GTP-binding protein